MGERIGAHGTRAPAVIIGLDSMQGLQVARVLAAHDVPVIGVAADRNYYSCSTRCCRRLVIVDTGSEELIDALLSLAGELAEPAVLYPCHDKSVLMISRHRDRLEPWFRYVLPDHEVLELLIDKVRFYEYAQRNELPIPKTRTLRDPADALSAANELAYPVVLKPPYRPVEWTSHTKKKAFRLEGPADLLEHYRHYSRWAPVMIAQEWVAGPESNLYSCNCYYSTEGKPLVTFVSRKLRQWPPETGQSCLAVECLNDELRELTLRLFDGVGFRGLGYLEVKRDERTGEQLVIEPNAGRPTGRSALAEAAGVELHYAMYCDVLGLPLPDALEQEYRGVKWIHILRDIQASLHGRRSGNLDLRGWLDSVRGTRAHAVLSVRDPLPFVKAVMQSPRLLASPRERHQEDL